MDELKPAVERYRPTLILDTNIWLDWLVFNDPATTRLTAARQAGEIQVLAGQTARDELTHVLAREQFALSPAEQAGCMARFDLAAQMVTSAVDGQITSTGKLQCSDPDDQQFLDLAVATGADYLLSKDKALLKLARRAWRDHQFRILTLVAWNADCAALAASRT